MKITVIVPAYQAESTIEKCIRSILSSESVQQVIIMDDGSTDATPNLCKNLALTDSRILFIRQENQGPAIARKNALQYVTQKYVTFVDSDDYVVEKCYDKVIFYLNEKIDIIEYGYKKVKTTGDEISVHKLKEEAVFDVDCLLHYAKQKNTTNYLWNKVIRFSLFSFISWADLYAGEDAWVLTQLFYHSKRYKSITEVCYNYVMTENSLVRSSFNTKKLDGIKSYNMIESYYQARTPALSVYAQYKICSLAVLLYAECSQSNIENKEEYLKKLALIFKAYIKKVPKSFLIKEGSSKRRIMIFMFMLFPDLTSWFINHYL